MPGRRPLALWKKALFAVVATVLFFGILEGVLGLLGWSPSFGTKTRTWVHLAPAALRRDGGRHHLATAENKLRFFNRQSFPRAKAADAYRIFCVGARRPTDVPTTTRHRSPAGCASSSPWRTPPARGR